MTSKSLQQFQVYSLSLSCKETDEVQFCRERIPYPNVQLCGGKTYQMSYVRVMVRKQIILPQNMKAGHITGCAHRINTVKQNTLYLGR